MTFHTHHGSSCIRLKTGCLRITCPLFMTLKCIHGVGFDSQMRIANEGLKIIKPRLCPIPLCYRNTAETVHEIDESIPSWNLHFPLSWHIWWDGSQLCVNLKYFIPFSQCLRNMCLTGVREGRDKECDWLVQALIHFIMQSLLMKGEACQVEL